MARGAVTPTSMRYLLLLVVLWILPAAGGAAQSADTIRTINRLPKNGLLLEKGWRYHVGDNPEWAKPGFDDRVWDTISPTWSQRDLPPRLMNGINWLRLRFRLGDSLRQQALLVQISQLGAMEIYCNGRLVQRQGTLHPDPSRATPGAINPGPVVLPIAVGSAEQVLAVRLVLWAPPVRLGTDEVPLLRVWLRTVPQLLASTATQEVSRTIFYVVGGIFCLLMLLHFAFFHYNPAQLANRYFALYALSLTLASLGVYYGSTLSLARVPALVLSGITFTLFFLGSMWAVRALYALFNFRLGLIYYALWGCLIVLLLFHHFHLFSTLSFLSYLAFVVLATAEQLRLTVRALRQRQRGAWIIGSGFALGLLCALLFASLIVTEVRFSMQLENFFYPLIYLPPALGISLFLAREFALDSQLLQLKLDEVKRLSAQTLAQEQEKQTLLAQQNETLEQQVQQRTAALQRSLTELRTTQTQLIQREKMASLGELTAGIAHEIQNPLNFVTNFADVSTELCHEAQEVVAGSAYPAPQKGALAELLSDLGENQVKITQHGQRAASIVRGMLEHARASTGERQPTDVNALCEEYLRLAYQGLRAKDKTFNATLTSDLAPDLPLVTAVASDLGRVLLNLLTNAFYAVRQRQQQGGENGYVPTVRISTRHGGNQVKIQVQDNGTGIPDHVKAKVFQPFFTTKPSGEGTGLGLSLSYDIITKGHGGTLTVESEEGKGSEFSITLPV
ncbi:ATP-binding protein [Hymenobacter radiodurans]|uniref:ATP-binding protein n=1 Tax=Hymenobacter radiodurans TaxID=2496028 RepID=UPI001F102577|nr:ATP-binding protein [Hymenobacter radiodurans]